MADHLTKESDGKVGSIQTAEEARAAHHLASADPEKDGLLAGVQHEEKYGLERAKESRALVEQGLATAAAPPPAENTSAQRAR